MLWRCAFNVEKPVYSHMARALTVAWAINAFFGPGLPRASVPAGDRLNLDATGIGGWYYSETCVQVESGS
jgi:hypothetical protein